MKRTATALLLSVTSHCVFAQDSSTQSGFFRDIARDYKNAYSGERMVHYSAFIVGGAALANTDADENIREWYQDELRSSSSDDFFKPINSSRPHELLYGLIGVTAFASVLQEDNLIWKYSSNTLRRL